MKRSKGKHQHRKENGIVKQNVSETFLIGTVSDLLEEIKKLLFTIRKNKKSKEESRLLFQSLLSHYRPLIGTNYRDVINLFIYDSCKTYHRIQLPLDEIKAWW